jgi:hypothetical protein
VKGPHIPGSAVRNRPPQTDMMWREDTRQAWLMDCAAMEKFNGIRSIIGNLAVGSYALFPTTRISEARNRINEAEEVSPKRFIVTPAGAGIRVTRKS